MATLNSGPAPYPTGIRIPAWQDVIHIMPRTPITPADRKAWNKYLSEGARRNTPVAILRQMTATVDNAELTAAGINPGKLETLLRGRAIYESMHNSQIPKWRQNMVHYLTILDNVEDQVSTVEWLTRPLTSLWAPTRAIAAVVRRQSDVLNGMEQILAGPSLSRALIKSKANRARRASTRDLSAAAGILSDATRWFAKNWGHVAEATQATDTWAGVGISLGAIYGAMEDAQDRLFTSAWEGAKFLVAGAGRALTQPGSALDDILQQQQDASVQRVRQTGAPLIHQMIGWANAAPIPISPFAAPIAVMNAAAQLQRNNDVYTRGEHALALYHSATISPVLGDALTRITDPRVLNEIPNLDAPRPRISDSYSRDLLEEAGATFDTGGHAIGEWAEPTQTLQSHVDELIEQSETARRTWLPQSITSDEEQFMHSLVEMQLPGAARVLTGSPDGLRQIAEPEARAEMLLYHLEQYPPAGTTREQLQAWLADQVEAINAQPGDYDWRTWRDVTNRHWSTSL